MQKIIKQILHINNISYKEIKKALSGFTNLVYFIDDSYVIKLSKEEIKKKKIEKEISVYKNIVLDFIPKYIASGEIQDYKYLIISRIKGESLYSTWHKLNNEERKNCITQIAYILKEFNNKDFNFLEDKYKFFKWKEYISNELKEKLKQLEIMGFKVNDIVDFIDQELPNLFKKNYFKLLYNDAHFDNFIYNNGKISLIDFDRVMVGPIDYEMLIFKTMCENPKKFACEEDEIIKGDFEGVYQRFKSEYSEIFAVENIDKRVFIYQFDYLLGQAINCKDYSLIERLLDSFKKINNNYIKNYK